MAWSDDWACALATRDTARQHSVAPSGPANKRVTFIDDLEVDPAPARTRLASARSHRAGSATEQRMRQQMAPIPRHEIVVVPGSRHYVMLDAPEAFNRALDAFLARV